MSCGGPPTNADDVISCAQRVSIQRGIIEEQDETIERMAAELAKYHSTKLASPTVRITIEVSSS